MATLEEAMEELDHAWDEDEGFLGKLHYRNFDKVASARFIAALRMIPTQTGDFVSRDLVRTLWQLPSIISWKSGDVGDHEETLQSVLIEVDSELSRIFGVA
ncbi:MAG TPA: hypothetical protein VHZ81_04415 [Galbitalea sp.]|jgi:hypothetical protein|nr:hypothetical protein [Galbitalea sp.]